MILQEIADELRTLGNLSEEQKALRIMFREVTDQIRELKQKPDPTSNPFSFDLKEDNEGYADESWENIIAAGQALQSNHRDKSEDYWTGALGSGSPWGPGGYGSFEAPKIIINCVRPVYFFKNTARLPGSFQVTSPAHMGSILRFEGSGDGVLRDNNAWWTQTDAPIGIYVEPQTEDLDGRQIHNFEQAISNVTIVGQNGSMPIYISDNAFNFRLRDCNIQAHQGSRIVIKHGPAIASPDWYLVEQKPSGNNYLPDPIFSNLLIEGIHKFNRRNAGLCVSGNNIQFHGLNFYGCMTGIMSTGQGRTVTGCTMHHGGTHDGRTWCSKDQLALGFLSRRSDSNPDSIQAGSAFPIYNPLKSSRAEITRGWYQAGEVII